MRLSPPIVFASCLLAVACASTSKIPPPQVTAPARLCGDPSLRVDDFCLPVRKIEAMLRGGAMEILHVRVAKSGFSRPKVVHLGFAGEGPDQQIVIRAKWKAAPRGGEGFNNRPHKELAAYQVQELFLEPSEYVVPPTIAGCIPLEEHRRMIGDAAPTFADTRCVFGVTAYWLQNATDDSARDLDRFRRDEAYRASLAKLNLLTYLIDHRDSRDANFLRSTDPDRPRVFTVDNGLAFGGLKNPLTIFMEDWAEIRVPALPGAQIEKLRAVTRADLGRLGVVAQYENREGVLVAVPPTGPLDEDEAVRISGSIVQLGLTREEIDGIAARLRRLLERVDAGEIGLF